MVDCTAIPPQRGGVGRYVEQVVAGLDALGAELTLVVQAHDRVAFADLAPSARIESIAEPLRNVPLRLVWEQLGLAARARRADVLWSPHYTLPIASRRPGHRGANVVTLHDATFFSDPDLHVPLKRRFFRSATRGALRLADACIVPSQATRDALVELSGADADRLHVVYHGVDHDRFRPPDAAAVLQFCRKHDLRPGAYIAFLGTLEPRKNLPALIAGWADAFGEFGAGAPPLVLAGGEGWDDRLDAAVANVPAGMRVVRTGYLETEELPALFNGALIVAYPSLGEGFGLPVLEAMACSAAVLTTRRLALGEVGGAAVAYTEPDAASIARELRALADDPHRLHDLRHAGEARAAEFTWERSAREHLDVFQQVAQRAT
jgi:glycosyltransferase involved in cell wall biosynthesis